LNSLSEVSTAHDLTCWVLYWSEIYDAESDHEVLDISKNNNGFLNKDNLYTIFKWKLNARDFSAASNKLELFSEKIIEEKTKIALESATDSEALKALLGLPLMSTEPSCAVASSLLMVLDNTRWTVIDVRANLSLIKLKASITRRVDPTNPLFNLINLLSIFNPKASFKKNGDIEYKAVSIDWPMYLLVCREIAHVTRHTLRTVDRALFQAYGAIHYSCCSQEEESPSIPQKQSSVFENSSQENSVTNRNETRTKVISGRSNLHDDFVRILIGKEKSSVSLQYLKDELPHRAGSGVLPGDHDPLKVGQTQICICNSNGLHIFDGPGKKSGEWNVATSLYWRDGTMASIN